VRDDIDWDSCPDKVWDKLLEQAPRLTTISRFWYLKGLHRAITEMERMIDGKPLWPHRQELIDHLNSIHAPH
jgi:hypothetical protein